MTEEQLDHPPPCSPSTLPQLQTPSPTLFLLILLVLGPSLWVRSMGAIGAVAGSCFATIYSLRYRRASPLRGGPPSPTAAGPVLRLFTHLHSSASLSSTSSSSSSPEAAFGARQERRQSLDARLCLDKSDVTATSGAQQLDSLGLFFSV